MFRRAAAVARVVARPVPSRAVARSLATDTVEPNLVTPTVAFKDLALDSLDVVECMAVEEEFAIEIPDAEADKITRAAARAPVRRPGATPSPARSSRTSKPDPGEGAFREAWVMFQLALRFVPENEDAQEEVARLQGVVSELPEEDAPQPPANHPEPYDVVVVGAGAAGVGVALMLTGVFGLDAGRVLLVERGGAVGETFRRWPKEMRFISPSFNSQGWTQSFDLNSVAYGTSPAFTLHAEHPTGAQYARYLEALAETNELNVRAGTEVTAVTPRDGGFDVAVVPAAGGVPAVIKTRYVVWAAGEFQYPRASAEPLFPGSELCRHNSSVRSWKELEGDDFVVVGGYESGMDAASNLSLCGKRCTVVSSTAYWDVSTEDPSSELAPYTAQRVRAACASATPPKLLAPLRVFAVDAAAGGGFAVRARWAAPSSTRAATTASRPAGGRRQGRRQGRRRGRRGRAAHAAGASALRGLRGRRQARRRQDLFAWGDPAVGDDDEEEDDDAEGEGDDRDGDDDGEMSDEGDEKKGGGCADGAPLLNEYDESTTTPGLFLVGPAVIHGDLSFCFVYKFRQRFGVVADAIARASAARPAAL
ncbi:pyridine nucleotide-disulfide oxidoreductase [Aureococcus anophagefferens]|nr:pyridine nucleotide-disulfide oxidoreductase [Aureococcus anophagefferens]